MSVSFGPGIPVPAVLGVPDPLEHSAVEHSAAERGAAERGAHVPGAPTPPAAPPPDGAVATTGNRRGTVTVTTTDTGLPVDVRIDPREMRYGGGELSAAILEVCRRSAFEAKARRREDLAALGVREDVLDRLGLPTRDALSVTQARADADEPSPSTWMRPV